MRLDDLMLRTLRFIMPLGANAQHETLNVQVKTLILER
jgi:hypothetical protein